MIDSFLFRMPAAEIYKVNGKNILKIYKNGSSTLRDLCSSSPDTCKHRDLELDFDEFDNKSIDGKYFLDVYLRDPVDRYFSAVGTVKEIYGNNIHTLDMNPMTSVKTVNNGFFFDIHFFPQYWFIQQAYVDFGSNDKLYFRFHDLNELNKITGNKRSNVTPESKKVKHSASSRFIVRSSYVFDYILYQLCIGKTMNYTDLIKVYGEGLDSRFAGKLKHYIEKTNPENHDKMLASTDDKIDHYNRALDQIAEIAKKSKKY